MARNGWSCVASCEILGLSGETAFTQKVLPAFKTVGRLLAADPLKTAADLLRCCCRLKGKQPPFVAASGWDGDALALAGVSVQAHRFHIEKVAKLLSADWFLTLIDLVEGLDAVEQAWFEKQLLNRLAAHSNGREWVTAEWIEAYRRQTDRPAVKPQPFVVVDTPRFTRGYRTPQRLAGYPRLRPEDTARRPPIHSQRRAGGRMPRDARCWSCSLRSPGQSCSRYC